MAAAGVIRDASETLARLVQRASDGVVAPGSVIVATPDEFADLRTPQQPTVTVFLYRIAINAAMRNSPRRVAADGRTTRPLIPLELSYLITPWAAETLDEHTILGRLVQGLYDASEVDAGDLVGTSWEPGDSLQLVFETPSLDEQYRIWDTVGDVPYRLSLAYTARVVGIEPAERVSAAPVAQVRWGGGP